MTTMRTMTTIRTAKAAGGCAALVLACVLAGGCSQKEEILTIAFSNDMTGEIRSCGCTSKDFGGLGRRATFLRNTRKTSGQLVLFEGGDFFGTKVNYGEEKAGLTLRSMVFMKYDGIVIGEKDLSLGVDYLVEQVAALRIPVVVANLYDTEADTLIFAPNRVFTLPGGLRVGVIGVMGERLKLPLPPNSRRVRVKSAQAAVEREVAAIKDDVHLVVVLAHMSLVGLRKLGENNPDIDLVVGGHDARAMRSQRRFGNAFVLQTANRGRYMGIAYATVQRNRGILDLSANVEALGIDYQDHEAIVKLFQSYDMEIARKERVRVRASVPSGEHIKNRFASSENCRSCHTDIYDHWGDTRHAHAFATLEGQNRQYDRDCTPCHVTGFYQIGGFLSEEETPEFTNVQCEACHGNAGAHVRNPSRKTESQARVACKTCHTAEQTPDFEFGKYWARIKHPPPEDAHSGSK